MNSEGSEAEDNQAVASGFEGNENELDSSPTMTDDVKDNDVKREGDSEKDIEKDIQDTCCDKKPSASNSFQSKKDTAETVSEKEVAPSESPAPPPVLEQKPKKKKVKRAIKYCKAPQAPKRFKSAYIF
jgi:hypothetical protein